MMLEEIWGEKARESRTHTGEYGPIVEAAAAVNNPRDLRMAKRLLQSGKKVDRAKLADPAVALQTLA